MSQGTPQSQTLAGRKAVEDRVRAWCIPQVELDWTPRIIVASVVHHLTVRIGGQVLRTRRGPAGIRFLRMDLDDSVGAKAVQQVDNDLFPPCDFVTPGETDDLGETCSRRATYRVENADGIPDKYFCGGPRGHARDIEDHGDGHPVLCFRPPPPLPGP